MDLFKVSTGPSPVQPITIDAYLRATGEKHPYCQTSSKGTESLFAVCPCCDNPIQIIGLYKKTPESGRKPYGKHSGHTIPGLAEYDQADYEDCLYSNPNTRSTTQQRRPQSRIARQILELLHDQFDRVVHIISRDTDILISPALARQMLRTYVANDGWLYKMATLNNLPWVLAEASRAYPLFGRRIRKGSPLYEKVSTICPEISLSDDVSGPYAQVGSKDQQYVNLSFVFLEHHAEVKEEHLEETIDFWVYRGTPPALETVFRKTLLIRTDY